MKNIKMIKATITIPLLSLSFIFTGCAGGTKKVKPQPPTYSSDVEAEFNNIENDQRRVLEYYRTLRAKNWEKYRKSDNMVDDYNRQISKKGFRRYQKPAPTMPKKLAAPKPEPVALPDNVVEEMKIEIRQHMSYYCMEKRKSNRFSSDADCSAFTENVSNECEKKYPIISDRSLVKCVKQGLR